MDFYSRVLEMKYMNKSVIAIYNVQLVNIYNDKRQTKKRAQRKHLCAQITTYNL